jgi:hypothetical protein
VSEFLSAATSFPTVVFSVLLIIVVLYWISVILGAIEVDILDGAVDGVLDGATEGLADDAGPVSAAFDAMGIGTVPATIILSLLIAFTWFFSLAGMSFVSSLSIGLIGTIGLGALTVFLALLASMFITSVAARPMSKLFEVAEGQSRSSLVGRICTITTQHVDEIFGQAEATDPEGASLILQVRSLDGTAFGRGDEALLIDFDTEREAFVVASPGHELDAM